MCDETLPSLLLSQFGVGPSLPRWDQAGAQSLVAMYDEHQLEFSPEEPAVNLYTVGGEFKPHKDHKALTVLVALSDPDSFCGGGTGLWSKEEAGCGPGDTAEHGSIPTLPPTLVVRPSLGSVILFGGDVMVSATTPHSTSPFEAIWPRSPVHQLAPHLPALHQLISSASRQPHACCCPLAAH